MTCGAHYWLTAEEDNVINLELKGDEQEWFNQQSASKYLDNKTLLPEKCQTAFAQMRRNRKTLKQEQMLEHNIKLKLYEL